MNKIACLSKLGYETLGASVYRQIELWNRWYRGKVPAVHTYRVQVGRGESVRRTRLSMGMAAQAAADLGGLLMSEAVTITLDDEKTNAFVQDVLERAGFIADGAGWQERKAAVGTIAYVPYFRDAVIDDAGRIVSGTVEIEYFDAGSIFPITWTGRTITECAFVSSKTYRGKRYAVIAIHTLEGGTYMIRQHVFEDGAGSRELTEEERAAIPLFADLVTEIDTGSAEPQFVIDRLNITNPDADNPMGVSVYARALDVLKKMDFEYDSYGSEFELGRKRIFVAPELLGGKGDEPAFDPADVVFYQLPEGYFAETREAIHETNPALRVSEHSQAIDDDLRYFASLCGFGSTHYRYSAAGVTTATQVISENSDLYRTVQKHEVFLADAIKQLVRIIIRLGNVAGAGLNEDAEIAIRFDDSIIQDAEAERKQDLQDMAAGVMSAAEYRAKWYGETLEQAEKNLPAVDIDTME